MKGTVDVVDKIEMEYKGGTVDVTELLSEVANILKLKQEAKGQIEDMLEEWAEHIYRTYKANGNKLAVNMSLNLKGGSDGVNVKSSISFTVAKITDKREAEIKFNQEKLPI